LGIKIPTGWTEPGMATKRDKLHMPTLGTGIHGAAIRRITTVNHLFNIFYLSGTWVKSVQDFFIMVGKDNDQDLMIAGNAIERSHKNISEIFFRCIWKKMQVLSYMFRIFKTGYYKIWGNKRELPDNKKIIKMPSFP